MNQSERPAQGIEGGADEPGSKRKACMNQSERPAQGIEGGADEPGSKRKACMNRSERPAQGIEGGADEPGSKRKACMNQSERPAQGIEGGADEPGSKRKARSETLAQDIEGGANVDCNNPDGCDLERKTAHTVLSYCDEATWTQASSNIHCSVAFEDDSLSLGEGDLLQGHTEEDEDMDIDVGMELDPYAYPGDDGSDDKHLQHQSDLCLDYPHSDSDTRSDGEEQLSSDIPRRQFKVPRSRPTTYNFSALPKQPAKGTTKKPGAKRKRVQLNLVPQLQHDNQGELSIFDFQPSQGVADGEKEVTADKWNEPKSKLNVSVMGRTREEQVSCPAFLGLPS